MNIALERLLEGIVTTLRNDVIPHVVDPYARGQAVGVIDLLNNIAPKLEWARGPLLGEIEEKRGLLRAVAERRLPELEASIDRATLVREWLECAVRCECPDLEACALFDDAGRLPPVHPAARRASQSS